MRDIGGQARRRAKAMGNPPSGGAGEPPEGVWYRCRTTEDVEEVLQVHVIGGGRVARLMLTPEDGPHRED